MGTPPAPGESIEKQSLLDSIDLRSEMLIVANEQPNLGPPFALFRSIHRAARLLDNEGVEMTIDDAMYIAEKFLTQGLVKAADTLQPLSGESELGIWYQLAEDDFWTIQSLPDLETSPDDKVVDLAIRGHLNGKHGTEELDCYLDDISAKALLIGVPSHISAISKLRQRAYREYGNYLALFRNPMHCLSFLAWQLRFKFMSGYPPSPEALKGAKEELRADFVSRFGAIMMILTSQDVKTPDDVYDYLYAVMFQSL